MFASWLEVSQAPVDLLLAVAKVLASGSQNFGRWATLISYFV